MFRFDPAHTGATPEALRLPLREAWRFPTGAKAIVSSAAVVKGVVYFGTRDDPSEAGAPAPPPAAGGGRGSLYAVDARTGKMKWRFHQSGVTGIGWVDSSPAVAEDRIYFSARDGYFYCVSTDGKQVWRARTGGTYDSSSPTVRNGRIYLSSGFPNRDFFCLSAKDGSVIWRTPTGNDKRPGQYAYSSPALVGDTVYVGANDAVFYALDAARGTVKWRFETSGNPHYFSPTVYKGKVYCAPGEFNPSIYGIDQKTGKESWRFTATGQYFMISSPAASDDRVYVSSGLADQTLYAIDAVTGKERWKYVLGYATPEGFTSSPAVTANHIVIGGGPKSSEGEQDGRLIVLDAATGAEKWKVTLPRPILSSPTVADGMAFVGGMDGVLYAFRGTGAGGEANTQKAKSASSKTAPPKSAASKPAKPVRRPPARPGIRRVVR